MLLLRLFFFSKSFYIRYFAGIGYFAGRLGAHASYFYRISTIKDEARFSRTDAFSRATQIEVAIEIESESEIEIEIEIESEIEIETQICCIQIPIINRKSFFSAYSFLSVFKSVFIKFQVSRL